MEFVYVEPNPTAYRKNQKKNEYKAIQILSLFLIAAALSGHDLRAQAVGGGQIQGLVVDTAGAAVHGARVTATQQDSGLIRAVTSGPDGGYLLPNLPVGPYQLDVTASGFSPFRQSGIVIQVGNNLRIDVSLKVGAETETVQVNAEASMVQT